jgi:hypothetical protein
MLLIVDNETHYQLSFASLVLLELKGLEEVNMYSIPSSLLVVKLISVERMDSAFLFLLLAVFSGFNCLLNALISSKRKAKDFFPGQSLASKKFFFMLFEFGNCSAISRVVVVLVTILTPHIGPPL